MKLTVKKIDKATALKIVGVKHYSRRIGIFWEGFGLFDGNKIVGVVCYGQPSAPIQKHAFSDREFRLYELSRLVVDRDVKNGASFLISQSLKMLNEQPAAIISYADSAQGHAGIVYQATNWHYTGATVAHDCLYLVDGVPTHPMTLRDHHGVNDPARWAKENNIEKIKPMPKHRYFFFVGNKYQKAEMLSKLKYPLVSEYPKLPKTLYDCGKPCNTYIEADTAPASQSSLF